MNLTKEDLQAIRTIVSEAIDEAKLHTAAGFAGVDEQLQKLQKSMDQVVRVQKAEVERVDVHDKTFMLLRKALHIA
jgi:hypothetical protein